MYDDTIDLGTSEGRQHALELSHEAQLPFAVSVDYLDTRKRKIDFDREAILEREERELARLARVVAEGRKLKRQATRDGAKSCMSRNCLGIFAVVLLELFVVFYLFLWSQRATLWSHRLWSHRATPWLHFYLFFFVSAPVHTWAPPRSVAARPRHGCVILSATPTARPSRW